MSIPDGTWVHDVSREHPDAVFRVVAVIAGEDGGVASLQVRTPDPIPIIAAVERRDDVADVELLWTREETTLVQVETTDPSLLVPLADAGIPLRTPFDVVDGTATWDVTTSSDRLSSLGTRLDRAGIDYELERVRDGPSEPANDLLTERQREVLLAAAAQGYYDAPRRATLTEVSDSLGISKATGSGVLHRAEGAVLQWFIEEHLTAGGPPVG